MKIQIMTNDTVGYPYKVMRDGYYKSQHESLGEAETRALALVEESKFIPQLIKEFTVNEATA